MKKKIMFMIINMNLGGTEKALINMVSEIPKDKFEITILMLENYGVLLESIPDHINVTYIKDYQNIKDSINTPLHLLALQQLREKYFLKFLSTILLYMWTRFRKSKYLLYKFLLYKYPKLEEEYDVAIAYAGPMDFISYFVAKKIRAKKRIQWIHFDVTKIGFEKKFAEKVYKHFDKVFTVSTEGKNKLEMILPSHKEKITCFHNVLSKELVVKSANEGKGFIDDYKGIRILTVGRLSHEKGQDLIIPVLAKLMRNGYNVKWYCIGEGKERVAYEHLAKEHKVDQDFILLGAKSNPFPYMKECDIYVQPSRHEGYCITLAEARCFLNPIITTNFTGADEQIRHNKTGLVVNFNEMQMYNAIKQVLDDKEKADYFGFHLGKELINTTNELKKLYSIVNEV
jgi:glycosyltransferase involved in cell wall biosynthesis